MNIPSGNEGTSIKYLKTYHVLLYRLVEQLETHGFEFTRESYEAGFDGSFAIGFRRRSSLEPPWQSRDFRFSRDGRDNILDLEELRPTPEKRGNNWTTIASLSFDTKDAWPIGILAAAQKLLQSVA
jgi:hypothetical protein